LNISSGFSLPVVFVPLLLRKNFGFKPLAAI